MLGNLRISYKLLMMIGLLVLGIAAVAGVGLSALWSNLLEDRKAKLQDLVLMARQALEVDYRASKEAGLSEAQIQQRSQVIMRTFRFGKDDYFYALNPQGLVMANANSNIEGKNLYDVTDPDGVFFVRESFARAASGGGFTSYRFPRASGGEAIPKLTFAVEFKPLGWLIGSGVYLDDVHAIFWSKVRQMGIMAGLACCWLPG
jgi:methyl-accepting chemotaxis protein